MNLLLLEMDECEAAPKVLLRGRRAEHLVRVIGVSPGSFLRAGIISGNQGGARVLQSNEGSVLIELDFEPALCCEAPDVDLILAVPRPKVLSRVIEFVASMGVGRIDLINSWRVEKNYFSSKKLSDESLRQDVLRGLEQGKNLYLPQVKVHRFFNSFIDEWSTRSGQSIGLLAHPRAEKRIEDLYPPGTKHHLTFAIGPEGGWIEKEVESFGSLGFQSVHLGESILRVESAVVALRSQVDLLRRLIPSQKEGRAD